MAGVGKSPLLLVVMLLFMTAGCGGPTPVDTPTPVATAVPTPTPVPSPTPLPTWTPIPTPVPGGIYVDAASSLGPISRLSFGTNSGPWLAVPFELLPQFETSGLTLLRYPGGNWGDTHNLLAYHISSFMDQVALTGAEPLISVRLRNGSPEKAVAVMELCAEKGLEVHYWSIGNEPSLYASSEPGYDTVRYNKEWREFALAMKAADPTIKLVGPDIHQYTGDPAVDPKDPAGRDWMGEFLRANGDLVDVVAIHRYPFPTGVGAGQPSVEELFADAERWDEIIRNLRAAVRENTGRDLPVAVTEFNSSWARASGGDTSPDSHNAALWLADVLGRLIRQGTDLVAHFCLQTDTGGFGLMASYEVRPQYYVYQMYRRFGSELLYASSDVHRPSAYAARRADGALTLLVVNLNQEAARQTIALDHFAPAGEAEVWLFDQGHAAQALAPIDVSSRFEYEFPPASVTLLIMPGETTATN